MAGYPVRRRGGGSSCLRSLWSKNGCSSPGSSSVDRICISSLSLPPKCVFQSRRQFFTAFEICRPSVRPCGRYQKAAHTLGRRSAALPVAGQSEILFPPSPPPPFGFSPAVHHGIPRGSDIGSRFRGATEYLPPLVRGSAFLGGARARWCDSMSLFTSS